MATIDANTVIDRGIQLSRNFLLEHLSSGAYQPIMAKWIPLYTSTLIPDSSLMMNLSGGVNIPLWKIVSNLQAGAEGMLEKMMNAFGGDLILRTGFANAIPFAGLPNEIQHLVGTSFDIQIAGFQQNMYGAIKEIQKVTQNADNLNLVFGDSSWMHIGFTPDKLKLSPSNLSLPTISTSDVATGITEIGLTSLRGFL